MQPASNVRPPPFDRTPFDRAWRGRARAAVLVASAACGLAPAVAAHAATASAGTPTPDVWVVDDDGGFGTDYLDLQSAVDAAKDGDVLLVRPGLYGSFEIASKGLSVAADLDGTVVCLGTVRVRDLPAGSSVTLRGLRSIATDAEGLVVDACAGAVWLEACTFIGAPGAGFVGSPTFHPHGHAGARVAASPGVAFLRCTFDGGVGADWSANVSMLGGGGAGIDAIASELALYDCVLRGGDGGAATTDVSAQDGGRGGDGLRVDAGEVTASGTSFAGGDGGTSGVLVLGAGSVRCGAAGAGGNGIGQPTPALGSVDLRLLACTFSVGTGGDAFDPLACPSAALGAPTQLALGSIDGLSGTSFGHVAPSPVRAGEMLTFQITGEPGSLCVLGLSPTPSISWEPLLGGAVLLGEPLAVVFPGVIGLDSTLNYDWNGALGVRADSALVLHAQPVFFVPSTFAFTTGPGSTLTILGSGL